MIFHGCDTATIELNLSNILITVIYFLASPAVAKGPIHMIFGSIRKMSQVIVRCKVAVSIYIAYISVCKSIPLAVTYPNGQLASVLFCCTWSVYC